MQASTNASCVMEGQADREVAKVKDSFRAAVMCTLYLSPPHLFLSTAIYVWSLMIFF